MLEVPPVIHYHGTPVGGPEDQAGRFLRGRHGMVSFANPANLGVALEACQSIVLDNGAFTLWRKGGDVDVDKYRDWILAVEGHPALDWYLIPDKIDGTEDENRALIEVWTIGRTQAVPIWHMHESLDWLYALVRRFPTVALGSSGQWPTPGTDSWWRRMGEAMTAACDSAGRPYARLHGLRMLDPEIFTRLPLASADSCNAAMNSGSLSRFGSYLPPTAAQRAEVIAARIEAHNSAPCWVSAGEQRSLIA